MHQVALSSNYQSDNNVREGADLSNHGQMLSQQTTGAEMQNQENRNHGDPAVDFQGSQEAMQAQHHNQTYSQQNNRGGNTLLALSQS